MKRIKLNKYLVMVLMLIVTAMLFLFGGHAQEGVSIATGAAVATVELTDAEKEGLEEKEVKFMHAVKKMTSVMIGDFKKGLITADQLEQQLKDFQSGVTKAEYETLEKAMKAQGTELAALKEQLKKTEPENPFEKFRKELEEKRDKLTEIKKNKSGQESFEIKVAAVTTTASSVVNTGFSAASLIRLGDGPIYEIARPLPFILSFVSVGQTDAPALLWFEELPKEGNFAITAEGALKPLVQYKFERRTADYRKAAGYTVITEEFDMDYPRLVSTIKRLMELDCKNAMNALILTDMIASASSYAYPALDDQIDQADDFGAIGAAIAQLQSLFYTPNVLVMNPADAWRIKLTKASDGHYVLPPFTWNGTTYEFGTVIVDPRVAAGNFFVGDGRVYNVDLRGNIIVRIGYANDDFIRNQYSLVVEQYFYNYISNVRRTGLIYGNFAAIKAAIETP